MMTVVLHVNIEETSFIRSKRGSALRRRSKTLFNRDSSPQEGQDTGKDLHYKPPYHLHPQHTHVGYEQCCVEGTLAFLSCCC